MILAPLDTRSYSPGERIPDTGVYQCKHSNQHTGSKEVIFESGKKFPLCGVCFWSVKYVLVANCSPEEMTFKRKKHEMDQALSASA